VANSFILLKEQNDMDIQTRKSTKRDPWFAAFLSLLLPGLGQLYCGAIIRCLWLLALTSVAGLLAVLALVPGVRLAGSFVVACYALSLLVYALAIFDAFFLARRTRADYELKDYNRWPAYLLLGLAVSAGNVFSAFYLRDNWVMPFKIPTASMYPALWQGDQLFADKGAYREKDPAVGDIVVFHNPDNRKEYFIKRVVALEGDRVEIRDGVVYVNDLKLGREEAPAATVSSRQMGAGGAYFYEFNRAAKYRILLTAAANSRLRNLPPTTVPKHHCFVLGDNRDNSLDSRSYGAIPIAGIVGKASFIYLPSESWARFGSMR
jgi:signal peptidase I